MKNAVHTHDVQARLNGLFQPDFSSPSKVIIDVTGKVPTPGVMKPEDTPAIHIHDARVLQSIEDDGSERFVSQFFDKHGFVLLQHHSNVNNWDSGASPVNGYSDELAEAVGTT